jgi:molybdopterin molybdotransferase
MSLITLDEARTLLLADLPALQRERVALDDALGRTLADPVIGSHTQPAEPRATMDGIAVPDPEPPIGAAWKLVGDARAGTLARATLKPGEAIRIATGAVVPEGAERVIPQEILEISSGEAILTSEVGKSRFLRRIAADFKAGDRLLERGTRIGPSELGLIAAANYAAVYVIREPRIAICTAGDELVAPGSALGAGRSVDSATHALAALIRRWGGMPEPGPLLPDDLQRITSALATAAGANDIVICIGGASVGSRDLMRPAARAIGAPLLFEGIAVQPGKPCWHGRLGDAKLLLGLPGNPSSAAVCSHLLLLPLIEALMGRAAEQRLRAAYVVTPLAANGDREQYLRATASYDGDGRLLATPIADQDSGLQSTLARAQILIRRPAGSPPLEKGGKVETLELTRA